MHATTQNHTPTPTAPLVRPPRPGEGKQCSRYADQAMHYQKGQEWIRDFGRWVDDGTLMTPMTFGYNSRASGYMGEVYTTPYVAVLDIGDPAPAGMIYAVQPMQWVLEDSGVKVTHVDRLVNSVIEINLLGVHKTRRRGGYGSTLLTAAEDYYRRRGFTTSNVIIDDKIDPTLRPWYEARGYTFHEHGERAVIQYATGQTWRATYSNVNANQLAGFKPLNPFVAIGRAPVRYLIPSQKMPFTGDGLVIRNVIA